MSGIQPVDLGSAGFKDFPPTQLYGVADADLLKEPLGRLVRSEHEDAALACSLGPDQGRRVGQHACDIPVPGYAGTYTFANILLTLAGTLLMTLQGAVSIARSSLLSCHLER